MTTQHILEYNHYSFACEVINGLNVFYGIPVTLPDYSEKDRFFNNDIRWGIVTISYLFRRDYFKIFSFLKKGLESEKKFKKYCMLISVARNDRYFFNFLKRISLIYEMAVYCYKNGNCYFVKARNCIARYQDKAYFHSIGSWPILNKTASFLRQLGNPFMLVIFEERSLSRPLRFSATVEKIENRLKQRNDKAILNSEEMSFLIEQKKKFIILEKDKRKNADYRVEKEKAFSECLKSTSFIPTGDTESEVRIANERKAIIEYLGSLLLSEVVNNLDGKKFSESGTSKYLQSNSNFDKTNDRKDSVFRDGNCSTQPKSNYSLAQERISDKKKLEENETSSLQGIYADLFISESSSDEDPQVHCTNSFNDEKNSLSKCRPYSSNESIYSEIRKMDSQFSGSSSSLEIHVDELPFECSSKDENGQGCNCKKKYKEFIKGSPFSDKSYSHNKSSTSEFKNSSYNKDDSKFKPTYKDLYNELQSFNTHFPDFPVLPDATSKQPTTNDGKPNKNTLMMVKHNKIGLLCSNTGVDLDFMREPCQETETSTEEYDQNSNKDLHSSTRSQQHRGRKNKRKRKGKRK